MPQTSGQASFALPESSIEKDRRGIATRIAGGEGQQLESEAQKLAKGANAGAVLVLAVGGKGGRWAVVAAWVPSEGPSARAFTSVAVDLVDAPSALEALVHAVLEPSPPPSPVKVGQPPPPHALDFSQAWLGLKPPPPPKPEAIVGVVPPKPLYQRPWVWGVVVGAAAVVAGGVTAAVILTRPPPPPPGVGLHVELPQ